MTLESRLPAAPVTAAHLAGIDELLGRYGWTRTGEPAPVPNSVLNENIRVSSSGGDLFIRFHKPNRTRERLQREHSAIRWAWEHGVPVNLPLASPDGTTVHLVGGLLIAAFPWLDARQLHRGAIDVAGAAALGDTLGHLHATLMGYYDPDLRSGGTGSTWETQEEIDTLSRVDDLIRYYASPGEWQLRVQEGLRAQLTLLESGVARPRSDFDALPVQPCHGDYHDGNVLFDGDGSVAAVVDWEMMGWLPRIFEVLRALFFAELLAPKSLEAFLAGYRRHVTLDPEEIEMGVEMWWQSQLHDTWVYRRRFIDGDARVDHFFAGDAARVIRLADVTFRAQLGADIVRLSR